MNIVICGAGEVGSHAAQLLTESGHNVMVIDRDESKLRDIEDRLDLQTLCGDCATAETLRQAGADKADLLVAATNLDEINLLTASLAKGVGARESMARVHHSTYFSQRDLDYRAHLQIDHLICPEYAAAKAIARSLRNPGALAIEDFARGQLEMQEFPVSEGAPGIDTPLANVHLPKGTRLATVQHEGKIFIPRADTVVHPGDVVILIGNSDIFEKSCRLFRNSRIGRRRIAIMGGTATAVYLSRGLRDSHFALRIFEDNIERARELADKLDWVTVINANPTDRAVFDEEHLDQIDAFVALLDDDDERNILACAWAKSRGVAEAIAVIQNPEYLHLLPSIGIDKPFSLRWEAGREIVAILDRRPIQRLATLAEGIVDVYTVRVGPEAPILHQPLKSLTLESPRVIAAIQRGDHITVPTAEDHVEDGDTLVIIGRHGDETGLARTFDAH